MEDLRSRREALNLSQVRLALLANVSRFKISAFESVDLEPSPDELSQIREALEARSDVLAALEAGRQVTRTAGGGMEQVANVRPRFVVGSSDAKPSSTGPRVCYFGAGRSPAGGGF